MEARSWLRVLTTLAMASACVLAMVGTTRPSTAAEYAGENLDGILFDAVAYSYGTSKYYDVQVEFDGDEATIFFARRGSITVTLDDEEIDDPHAIDAHDYHRGVSWELDVEGLE